MDAAEGSAERWRQAGRLVEAAGAQVFLRQTGAGAPLLLLHAYPTASWGFHKLWPELGRRYAVIAPDLPGSGFSEKPPGGDFHIGRLADVAEALLADLGVSRLHVLAHGYASSVGQELLARGRLRIDSIAFVSAGLFPEAAHVTAMQRLLLSPLGPLVTRLAPQPYGAFRRTFSKSFGAASRPSEAELRAVWTLLRHNGGQRSVPRVIGYLRERQALAARLVGALEDSAVPMALLCPPGDVLSGAAVIEVWRRRLPGRPVYLLPAGIGHYPPLECPQALLEAYADFRQALRGAL